MLLHCHGRRYPSTHPLVGRRRSAVVERLTGLGGRVLWEGREGPSSWVTMADPEDNEFCVA